MHPSEKIRSCYFALRKSYFFTHCMQAPSAPNQALNLPVVYFIRGAKSRAFDNYWRRCDRCARSDTADIRCLTPHTHTGAPTQPPLPRRPGRLFDGHCNCTWFQYTILALQIHADMLASAYVLCLHPVLKFRASGQFLSDVS